MFDKEKIILSGFANSIIRNKAKQIARCTGFTKQDHEDIEQELRLFLVQCLDQYDPKQGHINVFITVVIQSAKASILRGRWLLKRMPDRTVESINDSKHDPLGDSVPDANRSDFELFDLIHDVAQLVEILPPNLRDLAERLKTQTVTEIARELSLPRNTVQRQLEQLQVFVAESQFRNFF